MFLTFKELFVAYRRSIFPSKKNQIKYIFLSFLLAYTGSIDYLATFGFEIYPSGYISVLFLVIYFYAIVTHRLMDFSLAWRYGTNYILYVVITAMVFLPLFIFLRHKIIGIGFIAIIVFFLAPYLHRWLTGYFKPVLFADKYHYWKELDNLAITPERFILHLMLFPDWLRDIEDYEFRLRFLFYL